MLNPLFKNSFQDILVNNILVSGIRDDSIIKLFEEISRSDFLPYHLKTLGSCDGAIFFEENKDSFIIDISTMAHILDVAKIKENHNSLVISNSLGYSTALVAKLSAYTTSIFKNQDFLEIAKKKIEKLDIYNVDYLLANTSLTNTKEDFYHSIILEGAFIDLPKNIEDLIIADKKNYLVGVKHIDGLSYICKVTKNKQGKLVEEYFSNLYAPLLFNINQNEKFIF